MSPYELKKRMMSEEDKALPEGMHWKQCSDPNHCVIQGQIGFISIDFVERRIALGYSKPGRQAREPLTITGRGWKRKMVERAIEMLNGVRNSW